MPDGEGDAATARRLCRRLEIEDARYIEIESKRRVVPSAVDEVRKYLRRRRGVKHEKTVLFFDQFLDTRDMILFKKGASLRLRYKGGGGKVYLQYKGPGFRSRGVLYRSEFSSQRLLHLMREESRHDIVHFSEVSVADILEKHADPAMGRAMRKHLGTSIINRLDCGNLLCAYYKEKYSVDLGAAMLEPSLDQVHAFHLGDRGPHPVSTFWEVENEIKARSGNRIGPKLGHLDALYELDTELGDRFGLAAEPLDKYHRCSSFFVTTSSARKTGTRGK
jgi:hypothetical protein